MSVIIGRSGEGEHYARGNRTVTIRLQAGPGTLLASPPGTRHGFRNPGPGLARVLAFHAPDGGFADLVRGS